LTKVLLPALTVAFAAGVASILLGQRGLVGAGVGTLVAAAMVAVSASLLRFARRAKGQAILAAMLGGVAASFVILVSAMVALAATWREVLVPASLTALGVYLTYRFVDAFQLGGGASPLSRGPREAVCGGDKR
jgi:O-antigen/teichoic acid export membrane protein